MPQYLLSVCFDEPYDVDLSAPETQTSDGANGRAHCRDETRRRLGVPRGPAAGVVGDRGTSRGRRRLDDRRTLRRDQGADGRLLGRRGGRPRRRSRLGRQSGDRLRAAHRGPTHELMADLAEIFRREAGRCTATLIRVLGDIDLAEERWPRRSPSPPSGGRPRVCHRIPADGSPPPPATVPSTGCDANRPAPTAISPPSDSKPTTWNPTTTPNSTTSTPSSRSWPTTSCG